MNELDLAKLWNEKRSQIIMAQFPPTIILGVFFALAATNHVSKESPLKLKLLALAIVVGTGGLSILIQLAAIREGFATSKTMKTLASPSPLATSISISTTERYISWSIVLIAAVSVVNLGAILFFLFK